MCARNLRGGATRGNIPLASIDVAQFQEWIPADVLAQLTRLYACGNFGDPIVAPDLLKILAHARAENDGMTLVVHTNGSAKNDDFWKGLADLRVIVHFGIDGAKAGSHQRYRRKTNFDQILRNARTFTKNGGHAIWDMLLFEHNEDELHDAEALARDAGFRTFVGKSTGRFGGPHLRVRDATGDIVDTLRPSTRYPFVPGTEKPSPLKLATCDITCKAVEEASIYLSGDGYVMPCCWLGLQLYERPGAPDSQFAATHRRDDLKRFFAVVDGIGAHNLNLRHRSLRAIIEDQFPKIARAWAPDGQRLTTCARVCGEHGKQRFQPQFIHRTEFGPSQDPAEADTEPVT